MSAPNSSPLIIAVPAKGRLQENAESFFARAGMKLVKVRASAADPEWSSVVLEK